MESKKLKCALSCGSFQAELLMSQMLRRGSAEQVSLSEPFW